MAFAPPPAAARRPWIALLCAAQMLPALLLPACDTIPIDSSAAKSDAQIEREKRGSITGPGGIANWFGDAPAQAGEGSGMAVNAYLWRATLDTVSIFPVTSADPHGGVVLTDWYAPPATPTERFKLNVYIIDRALRADGVRVAVFRQVRTGAGEWQNAMVQPETPVRLEEAILMRARQLRNQSTPEG